MKYTGWVVVVLVLIGAGAYFFQDRESHTPELAGLQEIHPDQSVSAITDDIDPPPLQSVREVSAEQPPADLVKVTQEQRTAAIQYEEEILDLAREYESVRSDPEKRQALREEMKQQLALYSEAVLPIAMEKMDAMRSKN